MTTRDEKRVLHAALEIARTVGECIKAHGDDGIPSGHLYARMMSYMNIDNYTAVINALKRSGLVTETNHVLRWKA